MRGSQRDNEFYLLLLAPLLLLWFAPGLVKEATAWLLAHHVTVPAAQAALTLPATSIGLDGTRVTVAVCLLIAAACALASALIAKEIRQS